MAEDTRRRRHPLEQPFFCESSTQKWAAVFVAIGIALVIADGFGVVHHFEAACTFFLTIGSTFILGSSAADSLRITKCDPIVPPEHKDDPH